MNGNRHQHRNRRRLIMLRKLSIVAGLTALAVSASINADSFQDIAGNPLNSYSERNVLTNEHGVSRLQDSNRLPRAHQGRSPVYSPALNRRINQAEHALTSRVDRVGKVPQQLGNDIISIRRQSYAHLERQLKRDIRDQLNEFSF